MESNVYHMGVFSHSLLFPRLKDSHELLQHLDLFREQLEKILELRLQKKVVFMNTQSQLISEVLKVSFLLLQHQ
jgi:hypothetical protein